MAKFFGAIGYGESKEAGPGVWEDVITEVEYFGDVLQLGRRQVPGEYLNDDLNVTNKISIVADPFALQNFHAIRYVCWMGAKWKVSNVEVQHPRLVLTIGGVYNGQQG